MAVMSKKYATKDKPKRRPLINMQNKNTEAAKKAAKKAARKVTGGIQPGAKSLKGAGRSAVVGGITGAGQAARAAKLKNRRGAVGEGAIASKRVKGIGSVVPKGVKVTRRKTAKKKLKK